MLDEAIILPEKANVMPKKVHELVAQDVVGLLKMDVRMPVLLPENLRAHLQLSV